MPPKPLPPLRESSGRKCFPNSRYKDNGEPLPITKQTKSVNDTKKKNAHSSDQDQDTTSTSDNTENAAPETPNVIDLDDVDGKAELTDEQIRGNYVSLTSKMKY